MKFDGCPDFIQFLMNMNGSRVFAIACAGLGLMALSQILVAGIALAVRFEKGKEVRIVEKEVEKIVPIRITVPVVAPENNVPLKEEIAEAPTLAPEPLKVPGVEDPRSERLLKEARKARIAGDMGKAIVKLQEALNESPEDPNLLFEMGVVHEIMGVYGEAGRYYEKVFQLGVSGAGQLYQAAAAKLRDGVEQPQDMHGKIALGRVRPFNDPTAEGGQRVILDIPVQKAPGEEIDSKEIQISVTYFNKTSKGEIVRLEDDSWASDEWISLPFDWSNDEETLRMSYQIPELDAQSSHLFGTLTYYGQVVTLTYKGEVLDLQAWPRDLAARLGSTAPAGEVENPFGDFPEFLGEDILPPNFDPDIPLLIPLPSD